jgi:hypothetical protein
MDSPRGPVRYTPPPFRESYCKWKLSGSDRIVFVKPSDSNLSAFSLNSRSAEMAERFDFSMNEYYPCEVRTIRQQREVAARLDNSPV